MAEKVLLSWSGGKDSVLALCELRKNDNFEIVALITTITKDYDRVSMHGIRRILLEQQADSIGIPLEKIFISHKASNEEYESRFSEVVLEYKKMGISSVAFGDIFLEDIRTYREDLLRAIGMRGLFPIWGKNSMELANTFITLGFKAVVTCIDSEALDESFAGREYDEQFLSDLPAGVDPCGENGEFHTFAYAGDIFEIPIIFAKGEVVLRDNRFYYCDLIPT
ncbi:MAG: diphthine--ammonia ligase [Thermodesulfobacteriota bacterium]